MIPFKAIESNISDVTELLKATALSMFSESAYIFSHKTKKCLLFLPSRHRVFQLRLHFRITCGSVLTSTTRNFGLVSLKGSHWICFFQVLEMFPTDTLLVEYRSLLTFVRVAHTFYVTWRRVSFILVLWLYKEELEGDLSCGQNFGFKRELF